MRSRGHRRGQRGAALLLVLFLMLLVEGALLLFAGILAGERRAQVDSARRLRLDVLADGAADATLARLAAGDARGVVALELGGGELSSEVEPLGRRLYRIVARAELAGSARTVELVVERSPAGAVRVLSWRPRGLEPSGS
ncbi:MAG: hypothetical protein H6511_02045 [Holophagales bacterium]|nr:hypothetical protein [Holophagales bacterium]